MSNNYWQAQNKPNSPAETAQQQPRKSGLLGNYAGQQAALPQSNQPVPYTNQSPQPSRQPWNAPRFITRPAQMVQRVSAKMAAMRQASQSSVDPNPLVRYHAQQPPRPPSIKLTPPWRRSRTRRITHLRKKRIERWQRNGPNTKRLSTIISSTIAALLLITLFIGGFSSYTFYQSQLPHVQSLANLQVPQSSRIYDRNGNLLYTLYDGKYGRSTPVSYNDLPAFMQDAQIAAEDKTFWTNDGVDIQATLRSAIEDATTNQIKTGASTLTQQIVKNLTGNGQVTLQRKLSEAALAVGLTQLYPKWKILEMYLNISPYGAQEQGVEAAAQDFFGLKPICNANFKCTPAIAFLDRDLTNCKDNDANNETTCAINPVLGLARASLMAAIPQDPPLYDPLTNPGNIASLLQRQDYVLKQMLSDGMSINLGLGGQTQNVSPITPQVIQQAETLAQNFKFTGFQGGNTAPHFVRWVIQSVANALGNGDYDAGLTALEDSGLNIRTTLDSNLETYVETAINRHVDQPEFQPFLGYTETLSKSDKLHDSAAIVMDAKTGEVLAMDGSVDWNDHTSAGSGQSNMALLPRQPGSSFKPIVVAAAYEMGWYPGIVLPDFKTYFPQGLPQTLPAQTSTYLPTDYGDTYHNKPYNIEASIANSFNIPALKIQGFVGRQGVYNMAVRLGITSIDPKTGLVPSMALGTNAVPLLQMVGAYQTFANQGTRIPPQNVLDIWDNYGHNLYHYDPSHPAGMSVLSPQIAYLVTSTLDNEPARKPEFEDDHVLSMQDWPQPGGGYPDVAAKTGTTDSFKDNLTIGYTPDVVVGVWSGNADDTAMVNSIGVTGAAPIWHSIIEYISGKCNEKGHAYDNYRDADQVPCPPLDLSYTDRYFSLPSSGVIQQQVNTVNGLQGSGYNSYMLVGEQPQQTGEHQ